METSAILIILFFATVAIALVRAVRNDRPQYPPKSHYTPPVRPPEHWEQWRR